MTQYYDAVIEPRLVAMGENTKMIRTELMARIARVEEKIASLKVTMAGKWLGQ